jgi:L-alanine-DL-glutamate epimerase-like enolase superfamily enzyme
MKITALETIHVQAVPFLIFVRVHTDEGLIGTSDTYYTTDAIRGAVHEWAAPLLLGHDPLQMERHWNRLYAQSAARWAGTGVEMRSISAIDAALWDILGQSLGVPIHQLLGGLAHDRMPTYNTCGGPAYGRGNFNRLGDGKGPLEDLWAQYHEPEVLAQELLDEGIRAMKIWPFDLIARRGTGRHITPDEMREGLEPFRRIRDAVGDSIEIMFEGHGYWDITTAKKIARASEEYRPAWLEDLVLAHDIDQLVELKASTSTPILASELLVTRYQYRPLMEKRAADVVMIDPTWAGGITESRKIITMAESFGLPVALHDCTGPFTLLAGVHLAFSAPNAIYQEHVRAYIRTWYQELVPSSVTVQDGHILPPTAPGIGMALLPEVLERADATVHITRLSDR